MLIRLFTTECNLLRFIYFMMKTKPYLMYFNLFLLQVLKAESNLEAHLLFQTFCLSLQGMILIKGDDLTALSESR